MRKQQGVWQIGVAIALGLMAALAVAVCLIALVFGGRIDLALVAAVILLAVAQMVSYFSRSKVVATNLASTADLMAASETLNHEQRALRRRVERIEENLSSGRYIAAEQLDAQLQALEQTVSALSTRALDARPQPEPGAEPVLETGTLPKQLDLYLEPVVRLADSQTAFYRASLMVRKDDGESFPVSSIAEEADRAGFLSALDLAIFERAAPVIRRLRFKGRDVAVFCPVHPQCFADDEFVEELVSLMSAHHDIAGALVIELSQDTLGRLSERGQEGLAHLAELGATFALSEIRIEVPDLRTLAELGFVHVCADVRLLVSSNGKAHPGLQGFLEETGAYGLTVIAANIAQFDEFGALCQSVPYGFGPYFSPPRLVRHDITAPEIRAEVA